MALTLPEAAKGEKNVFTRGVIETFTENQRITQVIPFRDISGGLDGITQESVLPAAETRGVNEAFAVSEGRIDEIIQSLKIYGGDIGIDPFILATKGAEQAARHIGLKVKAISNRWVLDFIKGDSLANLRDFDGIQNRVSGAFNVISAGVTAGGAALSLALLDDAIQRCHSPRALLMGRGMSVRMTQAGRAPTVSNITTEKNEFGRPVTMYNDLEVIPITDNSANDNILGFTEIDQPAGASTASSIYVVGVGDEGLEGIQNGRFRVRGLGESAGGQVPSQDTRVEWYNNFHMNHPRSVIRVQHIGDLAIVT